MAKQTTLQINSRDTNNNPIQKSIAYAKGTASNYVLDQFAKKLNSLTTNTFVSSVRIDKEDITDAANE